MPVQKTFTIVPTTARDASPTPAAAFAHGRMTSKQVKEAYKAATKTPRMSRAERIKWEREEQQRIRKEMEREKAAAKAKLLRDKKKEKEKAEMEVKRREGRPLVNVRPSQDTIARFVRGQGIRAQRNYGQNSVKCTSPAQPTQPAQPVQAAQPTSAVTALPLLLDSVIQTREDLDAIVECEEVDEETSLAEGAPEAEGRMEEKTIMPGPSEEPKSCTTTLVDSILKDDLPSDLLQSFQSSISQQEISRVEPKQTLEDETLAAVLDCDLDTDFSQEAFSGTSLREPPRTLEELPRDDLDQLDALLDDDLELDGLDVSTGFVSKNGRGISFTSHHTRSQEMLGTKESLLAGQKSSSKNPPVQPQSEGQCNARSATETTMQPPPVPRKADLPSPPTVTQQLPLSTQAIMLNLDEFFPSASQQARELDDDFGSFLTSRQVMPPPPAPPLSLKTETPSCATPQRSTVTTPKQVHDYKGEGMRASGQRTPQQPSPSPKRWFTSSGSRELESLMLQRSRRTAALEEIRHRERSRAVEWPAAATDDPIRPESSFHSPTGSLEKSSKPHKRGLPTSSQGRAEEPPMKKKCFLGDEEDKENVPPPASQETDYGGGWADDFEL